MKRFFMDHGCRDFAPTFGSVDGSDCEKTLNTKETFVELLGLVLGVAMQCDQSREVIIKITEMDE